MARTVLTAVEAPGSTNYLGAAATFTAADASNFNATLHTGREMIIANNTGGSAVLVTIESAPDALGRTKDAAFSVPAGAFRVFGPFRLDGWRQTDGYLNFKAATADVEFLVVRV